MIRDTEMASTDPNRVVEPLTTIQGRPGSFSPDGKFLAFCHGGAGRIPDIMLVPWPEPLIGDPELLFEGRYNGRADLRPRYDIGPEGEDFLMLAGSEQQWPNEINVVLNWTTALLR